MCLLGGGQKILCAIKNSVSLENAINKIYEICPVEDVYDIFSPSMYHKPYRLLTKEYYYTKDVRFTIFESLMREIYRYDIEGAVAECGVNRGESAKVINRLFPDRKLYLFDTFEGFDKRDLVTEVDNNLLGRPASDFSNTSVALVMDKMINRKKVLVHPGWFPQSASGIDEKFCFVHLDMDLHDPIYAGLEFFWPRLSKGGYILIHDGRNGQYLGAIEAVREFCAKNNVGYSIMPDFNSTCIISK